MQTKEEPKKDLKVSMALSTPRTLYIKDYVWTQVKRVASKLRLSPSQLINKILLENLKDNIPLEEFQKAQKFLEVEQNMKMEKQLFTWLKQIRRSGAWSQETYSKILAEGDTSSEETEAYRRLMQQREKLVSETTNLILQLYDDLGTFKTEDILKTGFKKWMERGTTLTPTQHSIGFNESETPFMDSIRQKSTIGVNTISTIQ